MPQDSFHASFIFIALLAIAFERFLITHNQLEGHFVRALTAVFPASTTAATELLSHSNQPLRLCFLCGISFLYISLMN